MVAEVEVVEHVDDVVRLLAVLEPQVVQHADFHQGLVVEALLVSVDRLFEGYIIDVVRNVNVEGLVY